MADVADNTCPTVSDKQIGIDLGLTAFVTTSDGEKLGDSKIMRCNQSELRRRQRALSRCRRGSGTRKLVKQRVTKLHAKVANTRRDTHHKVAKKLVTENGLIAAERLNVTEMLKNRRLSRSISDAGWSQFIGILQFKAACAGVAVKLVDPKYTSQDCSECGARVSKSLRVRIHRCACGCKLDRDVNAARNILARIGPGFANVDDSSR